MFRIIFALAFFIVSVFSFGCGSNTNSNSKSTTAPVKNENSNLTNVKAVKSSNIGYKLKPELQIAETYVKEKRYTDAINLLADSFKTDKASHTVWAYAMIMRDRKKWEREVISYEPIVEALNDKYEGELRDEILKFKKEYYAKKNYIPPENPLITEIKGKCKNLAGEKFIDADVVEGVEDNSYSVVVKVKAINKSFTDKMLVDANLDNSVNILKELYLSNNKFIVITVISYIDAIDSKGNHRDSVFMKCTLKNQTARGINWNNTKSVKWEYVLDEYRIPKDLQKK